MTAASTSREAVERAIHWWQQQDRGSEEDGAASAELGRICRALLAERDELERNLDGTLNVLEAISKPLESLTAAEWRDEYFRRHAEGVQTMNRAIAAEAERDAALRDLAAARSLASRAADCIERCIRFGMEPAPDGAAASVAAEIRAALAAQPAAEGTTDAY